MRTITLPLGFNWHNHLRLGELLKALLIYTLMQWGGTNVMPNPNERPIVTPHDLEWYYRMLRKMADELGFPHFRFSMAMYVTPDTTPDMIYALKRLAEALRIHVSLKVYPKGKTTNSHLGIADFDAQSYHDVLTAAGETEIPVQLHGEAVDDVPFGMPAEVAYIPILHRSVARHPKVRFVVEHLSRKLMLEAVNGYAGHVGASVTMQHLLNTSLDAQRSPHYCCAPAIGEPEDRDAIQEAILAALWWIWYGNDNAPHPEEAKLLPKPATGVCSCVEDLPVLIDWFLSQSAIGKLGPFTAHYGCDWYGIPRCDGQIVFEERPWIVPVKVGGVVPAHAGETLAWQFARRIA